MNSVAIRSQRVVMEAQMLVCRKNWKVGIIISEKCRDCKTPKLKLKIFLEFNLNVSLY